MKTTKNRLLIGLQLAILLILVMGCTTLISDNNMKWTVQYNFMDLYKKISINYKAVDGIKYAATITFDSEQSAETYRKVFGEHPEEVTAQLYFRLNRNNTHVTTRLIGSNGKDLIIEPKSISIAEINQNRAPFD